MFRVVIRTGGRGFQIIDTILAFADEGFSSSAVTIRRRIVRRISEYRTNVVSSIEGKGSTAGVPQWIPGKSVEETCLAMEFRQVPNEGKAATSTDFYRELHSRGRRRMRASNINIFSFEPLKTRDTMCTHRRIFRSQTASIVEYEISVRYVKVVRLVRSRAKRANTRGGYSSAVDVEELKRILRITNNRGRNVVAKVASRRVQSRKSQTRCIRIESDAEHGNRIPTRLNLQEAAEVALRAEVSDLLTSWLVISTLYDSR
ncbi:hypothetical protein V1477_018143 [Vespula maculifrons]|uniref:Uncharacterized protein n=1 Tax=Vespula maculifrons TaxID=7453 RepID=A0ABD2B134_VESMC